VIRALTDSTFDNKFPDVGLKVIDLFTLVIDACHSPEFVGSCIDCSPGVDSKMLPLSQRLVAGSTEWDPLG
jgi:hypothetical protein